MIILITTRPVKAIIADGSTGTNYPLMNTLHCGTVFSCHCTTLTSGASTIFASLSQTAAIFPAFIANRWHRDTCVPNSEVRAVIESEFGPLKPFVSENAAGPSDNFQIPDARGVIGFISPITRHFCGACRRLRLTADGRIRPCLLSDTEIDVKSPLRGGCDDAELERLFRLAIEIKPDRHYVNETGPGCFQRTMSKIGG